MSLNLAIENQIVHYLFRSLPFGTEPSLCPKSGCAFRYTHVGSPVCQAIVQRENGINDTQVFRAKIDQSKGAVPMEDWT